MPTPRSLPLIGLFSEMDAATSAFAAASGLRCPELCGTCCENPDVRTTVTELGPLAEALVAEGQGEAVLARAEAAGHSRCIFYAPAGPGKGRCSVYALRPGICRLFGFAAVRNKRGEPELAACKIHQAASPEAVAEARARIAQGTPVPLFGDFQQRAQELGPSGTAELLPFNLAVHKALERALLRAQLEHPGDHGLPAQESPASGIIDERPDT